MLKQDCRSLYKSKRLGLSEDTIQLFNTGLLNRLQSFDWANYKRVHVFLSMAKFKEPDTFAFIAWIREEYPGIELIISKSDLGTGTMQNYLYDNRVVLEENAWGIPEPIDGTLVDNASIDAVLVPMLVCDQLGNRVGFGKGFYDRFLSTCRDDVVTLGLSFFEPIDRIVDADPWDYPLSYCITPERLYTFETKNGD